MAKELEQKDHKAVVAKLLREVRLNAGLSQNKMAELINCPQTKISKWESGETLPRLELIDKWLGVCGYSVYFSPTDNESNNKISYKL